MLNFKGKTGILNYKLDSAPGGIKIAGFPAAHQGISIHASNSSAVQFPIPKGSKGTIVDENANEVVVEFILSSSLSNLYNSQSIRLTIKKPYLGSIIDIRI